MGILFKGKQSAARSREWEHELLVIDAGGDGRRRDRHLIMIAACYAGPESEGAGVMPRLRQLGEPVVDTFRAMPPSELVSVGLDAADRRLRGADRLSPASC